jgi:hypothetical protein
MDTRKPKTSLETACHICGGTSFEWGQLDGALNFFPKDTSFLIKMFSGDVGKAPARLCKGCDNIQMFKRPY